MSITKDGKYKGKACGQVVLGKSAKKGTPQIEFYCEITQGEFKGEKARWTGYFGPGSAERTVESLQYCGWQGEDLGEFADGELHGLDANEVELVVEIEEYEVQVESAETGETHTEKRSSPKVQWINGGGGFVNVQNAMPKEEAASFGERMKGLVLKTKAKKPAPAEAAAAAADFPHGANAPPQAAAGGVRKGW